MAFKREFGRLTRRVSRGPPGLTRGRWYRESPSAGDGIFPLNDAFVDMSGQVVTGDELHVDEMRAVVGSIAPRRPHDVRRAQVGHGTGFAEVMMMTHTSDDARWIRSDGLPWLTWPCCF